MPYGLPKYKLPTYELPKYALPTYGVTMPDTGGGGGAFPITDAYAYWPIFDPTQVTLNGSNVSSVTDQTANAVPLTQGTASAQPLLVSSALNSQDVAAFTPADVLNTGLDSTFTNRASYAAFSVFTFTTAYSAIEYFYEHRSTSVILSVYRSGSSAGVVQAVAGGTAKTIGFTYAVGTYIAIYPEITAGGTFNVYVNNSLVGTQAVGGVGATTHQNTGFGGRYVAGNASNSRSPVFSIMPAQSAAKRLELFTWSNDKFGVGL